MKKPVFTGAAVAIITPMNADGSVNFDELGRIIEDQIAHSTDAIVICGTTGESPTLTDEEHTACIRYAVEKTAGRVPVIAGTGSNDTKYAIWLSQQAEADGADALLLVTPYYNKTSQAGLIAHYTAIADAVHLPCILYNVPSRTGCISVRRTPPGWTNCCSSCRMHGPGAPLRCICAAATAPCWRRWRWTPSTASRWTAA